MPYSANSSQIIYLTNPSTDAVDVNVKAYDDSGNQFDLGVIVQAPGRTVTKLASLLSTALGNAGFNGGKVTFEFNLSNAAAHVYFSYNVGTVRGYVAPIRELYPLPQQSAPTPVSAALGVKITCPFMPYSANTSQIIYLTNPSTDAVDVNVKAYDDSGNQFDLGVIVQAPGRTVTKLNTLLSTALANAGFTSGKVTLEFNLSNAAAHAYFSFNAGSVRGYVAPIRELYPLPQQSANTPQSAAFGVKITCPYMPYNANSSQIIYLTNPSTDAVDVNVKAYDDSGNQFDLGVIVQAPGRTVTKLASQLSTALANAGFNGGKVTLEFNLSNAAAHIYFSYNASSVRGYVAPIRELYPLPQQSANTMESAALGVKITCPYMPYNATSSQIIYLTNPSTNAVDVNVKAYDESGNQFDLGVIVQAPGRTVTKLASLLSTALANADFNDGKVTFEFNLSNAAAHAYFSCNEDSVRGYVAPIRDFCILPSENP